MSENKYFYIENGSQTGPVTAEELISKITPNTDIWCPGMANWAPANTVPEVSALFGGMSAPSQDGFNSASSQYDGGNSQNYGNNQSYADVNAQSFGNPQYNGNAQGFGNSQGFNPQQPAPNFGTGNQDFGGAQGAPAGNKPDTYLVWSILSTILCCSLLSLPFGIISIVNAAKVDSEWNKGNYAEAQKASENAKKFAIITAIVGLVVNLISTCITLNSK